MVEQNKEEIWEQDFSEEFLFEEGTASMQGGLTLAIFAQVPSRKRICEVACGTGHTANLIIQNLLREGGAIFATDMYQEMLKFGPKVTERAQKEEGTKIVFKEDFLAKEGEPRVDVEKIVSENMKEGVKRLAHFSQADACALPFADASFDAYIANYCLMDLDHLKQISESFRVLQPGSFAAFSVWGRPEKTLMFTFLQEILKEQGLEVETFGNYEFSAKPEERVKEFEEAGFINVKFWYQQTNMNYLSFESYWKYLESDPENFANIDKLEVLKPGSKAGFKDLLEKKWNEECKKNGFANFESLMMVAEKP